MTAPLKASLFETGFIPNRYTFRIFFRYFTTLTDRCTPIRQEFQGDRL